MFIKPYFRRNKTSGEDYTLYKLCESYRSDGRIRHNTIIGFGKLEELPTVEEKKQLALRVEEILKFGVNTLVISKFDDKVEKLALKFYQKIIKNKSYDVAHKKAELETVDMSSLKNSNCREIGAEWLCKQAFDQLKIEEFLLHRSWTKDEIQLATSHIISRAVYPASELKTVSFMRENSAICELTGYDLKKVTKDKLYAISHKLYSEKNQLEQYLSKRTNELFDLEDKIILYDLTNTYFEGQMRNSHIAKFGRSKEKRSDARLVVLAVVVNCEGFLKYSNIFAGNTTDSKTLETVVDTLSSRTSFSDRKPIVVMDAGIATEDNVQMLRQKGYDYLCVSRSNMKDYYADTDSRPVVIKDKKNQPIELLKVKCTANNDHYLWVKSEAKALKESSMNSKLAQRFEEGIENIDSGVKSKSGTKKLDKVHQRIGRLKQKYPSVHRYYNISVLDDGKSTATSVKHSLRKGLDHSTKAGVYFLRTSLDENNNKTLWLIYNTIREIEYTFRVLKTDLNLRPIYHKTDEASMAHLHLGLLAYWLVSTIRHQLKQGGYRRDWREIIRTMNTQKCVTTTITNIDQQIISIRKCTEPTTKIKEIYDKLKYKYAPFYRKKSVVLPAEILKIDSS